MSVFVALPNTAAYPIAAIASTGKPNTAPSTNPRLAPIENKGVTSPPWKPIDNVNIVSASFTIQSKL